MCEKGYRASVGLLTRNVVVQSDDASKMPLFNVFISHKRTDAQDFARSIFSLLTAAGCRELVCDTPAQYEELAVKMAVDADYYYKVRQMLEDARQAARLSPRAAATRI